MARSLQIEREPHGDVDILRPHGEIDLNVSPDLRRALLDRLAAGRDVLVDMERVAYIDSSGIASLAEALHVARRQGRRFALARVPEPAMKVLRIARLDQVFPIHDVLDPAFGNT